MVNFAKRDPIAGWAADNLQPHILYKHMLFEACTGYHFGDTRHVNITPDGGKYCKKIMAQIQTALQNRFTNELSEAIIMKFADSQTSAGIQVADIISSTVYRAISSSLIDITTNPFCGRLAEQGRLTIQPITLRDIVPQWLEYTAQ